MQSARADRESDFVTARKSSSERRPPESKLKSKRQEINCSSLVVCRRPIVCSDRHRRAPRRLRLSEAKLTNIRRALRTASEILCTLCCRCCCWFSFSFVHYASKRRKVSFGGAFNNLTHFDLLKLQLDSHCNLCELSIRALRGRRPSRGESSSYKLRTGAFSRNRIHIQEQQPPQQQEGSSIITQNKQPKPPAGQ